MFCSEQGIPEEKRFFHFNNCISVDIPGPSEEFIRNFQKSGNATETYDGVMPFTTPVIHNEPDKTAHHFAPGTYFYPPSARGVVITAIPDHLTKADEIMEDCCCYEQPSTTSYYNRMMDDNDVDGEKEQ